MDFALDKKFIKKIVRNTVILISKNRKGKDFNLNSTQNED